MAFGRSFAEPVQNVVLTVVAVDKVAVKWEMPAGVTHVEFGFNIPASKPQPVTAEILIPASIGAWEGH